MPKPLGNPQWRPSSGALRLQAHLRAIGAKAPSPLAPLKAHLKRLLRPLLDNAFVRRLRALGRRLANAGTAPYPPDVRRRLKILNVIAYLIATTTLIYAIQQATTDFNTYAAMVFINLALVATALMVPFAHRISDIAGGLLLIGAEYAALFAFTEFFSREGGAHLQYIIAAAATFVIFGLHRIRLIAVLVVTGMVLHILAWFWFPAAGRISPWEQPVVDSMYIQGAVTTVILIAASVYYAFSLAEQAKAETDAVLRNVLPDAIVERLKANPGALIADSIEEASVMFADISGFVALSRRLGANATVEMLSRIVSDFDALAVRHGVEKIKTIGDAYMVVAGLPEPASDHTLRLARMGLSMLETAARFRRDSGLAIQPAHRHGVRAGDGGRHRHAQVQL
ncbi:MAG: adenylate/guanylate cyclase domain-containing protein [Hyphomicrobium sp.]